MFHNLIRLTMCLTLMTFAASAWGQAPSDSRDQARAHFVRGNELVAAERWEEALREFDASLRLYPSRTALYNRALCLGLLGRPADGVRALEQYQARFSAGATPEQQAEVERELDRLRERVGLIDLRVDGAPEAGVYLDGELSGRTPLEHPLAVNPGRHNLEVRADGYNSVSRWVNVEAGNQVRVVMTLGPAGHVPAPPVGPTPVPAPFSGATPENTPAACGDGRDNDSDGLVDCLDPDCGVMVFCGGASFAPPLNPSQPGFGGAPQGQLVPETGVLGAPPAPTPAAPITPSPGWSLGAGIAGFVLSGAVLGLGLTSEYLVEENGVASLALGLSTWTLLSISLPVIEHGVRSARNTGMRGCRGCRIPAWILYALSSLEGLVVLVASMIMGEEPPFGLITAGSVVGTAAVALGAIDAMVAYSQGRRAQRALVTPPPTDQPESPAAPNDGSTPDDAPAETETPAATSARGGSGVRWAPFITPVTSVDGGGGALLGFTLVH